MPQHGIEPAVWDNKDNLGQQGFWFVVPAESFGGGSM
jgi:hypothetical protein